ncbi:MAG: serine hydrolase [Bacteroidales bacterium]|nr:serine hydrolase [Bacteroidales bacterium]
MTMLRYGTPNVDDNRIFASREIKASSHPYFFSYNNNFQAYLDSVKIFNPHLKRETSLDSLMISDRTRALLIFINNNIVFEKYYYDTQPSHISSTFSVSKSFLSTLTGILIENGYIRSIDEPITNYITELKKYDHFNQITIKYLLQMSSGLKWNKDKIFDDDGRYYYSSNIRRMILRSQMESEPGKSWKYKNIDTELLCWVLEKSSNCHISELMQKYLWEPLGAEYNASWSLDRKGGVEKASSSLNASPRDLLKFGCLYLNTGKFNGNLILSEDWINQIYNTAPAPNQQEYIKHNYLWWIPNGENQEIVADGFLGQRIMIIPGYNMVVVRVSDSNDISSIDKILFYIINNDLLAN